MFGTKFTHDFYSTYQSSMKSMSMRCSLSTEVYFKAFIRKECVSVNPKGNDYYANLSTNNDRGYFTCGDASKL